MTTSKRNKLLLFYSTGLVGRIITHTTRSPFAHAAIEFDGKLYDASESRGDFARSAIDPAARPHISIEFDGDLSGWLRQMEGSRYDWRGVLGWVFKANDRERYYCFEAAWQALKHAGVVTGLQPARLSGSDLLEVMLEHNQKLGWQAERDVALALLQVNGGYDMLAAERVIKRGPGGLALARVVNRTAVDAFDILDGNVWAALRIIADEDAMALDFEERLLEDERIAALTRLPA